MKHLQLFEEFINEAKNAKKDTKKIIKLVNKNIEAGSDKEDALMDVLIDGGYFDETSDEYMAFVDSIDSKLAEPESDF
tara:strand:+ start:451 stop:684 length:234 start_codon:yes stop_codon:yes gene_type:complete